ncbi:MAG TPA: hypothetical protein PLN69_09285 [bacterium]|nr:hypothetical protein [bacterium]
MRLFKAADTLFLLVACFLVLALMREQMNVIHKQWKTAVWADDNLLERPSKHSQISVLEMLPEAVKKPVADIYWIKAMTLRSDQAFEMIKEKASGAKLTGLMAQAVLSRTTADSLEMYDLIRMVTILDPEFEYSYYYGATLLSWDDQIDLAISLTEAGLRNNPESAMMASSLSFMHYYFMGDWERGAYYAGIAHRNGGKYSVTANYVADLYAAGRNYEMAIKLLTDSLEKVTDKATREQIENQIGMLMVELHIEKMEKAADRFRKTKGRAPANLDELVSERLLRKVPVEPFGGRYVINGESITNEPEIRNCHYRKMREYQSEKPTGGRKRL